MTRAEPTRESGARVAVVGATGAVGRAMFETLARRNFPAASVRAMASARSAGSVLDTPLGDLLVEDLESASFDQIDIALFSAGGSISATHAPRAAAAGAVVIDNTSAFRLDPKVALVVPEVNAHRISASPGIIANPNCSTIQMVLALEALRRLAGLESVRVATYQSASGAGQKGIDELLQGVRQTLAGEPPQSAKVHARPLPFNCVPQIGTFDEEGYTTEELKMVYETRKILELEELPVSATCVRVPTIRSHCEVVHVVTRDQVSAQQAKTCFAMASGLEVVDDPTSAIFPTAIDAAHRYETLVGRVRRDLAHPRGLVFWVVSDNLLKGAALNAVQIAELVWQEMKASA